MIATSFYFPSTKRHCEIPILYGSVKYRRVYKFRDVRPISGYMLETVQDKVIAIIER